MAPIDERVLGVEKSELDDEVLGEVAEIRDWGNRGRPGRWGRIRREREVAMDAEVGHTG
jgi:hypothetical protein